MEAHVVRRIWPNQIRAYHFKAQPTERAGRHADDLFEAEVTGSQLDDANA
jgi:hypothetical protein